MRKQCTLTDGTSLGLVTECINDLGGRADESQSCLLDFASELCVLRQESITVKLENTSDG